MCLARPKAPSQVFCIMDIKKGTNTHVLRHLCLTLEMLLAGHVVPDTMHLLGGDLMYGDDSAVPAETVGHFPVIKATVLIRVNAQLPQTHPDVNVLQMQESGVQGSLVDELRHIRREHVPRARAKRRVLALGIKVSGHVPFAAHVPYGSAVDDVPGEVPPSRFGRRLQEFIHQVVHVHKDIAVRFHHVLGLVAERRHPAHTHKRFESEVVVRVDEVFDYDVVEDLAFLLHHLVEHRIRAASEKKQRYDAKVAERALVAPRLPDGLAGVELLVRGRDEDDEEGHVGFAFLGLVDDEIEGVWVQRTRPDVAESGGGVVLERFRRFTRRRGQLARVG